jgi:hypothetical protein
MVGSTEDVMRFALSATENADEVFLFFDDFEEIIHHLWLWFNKTYSN